MMASIPERKFVGLGTGQELAFPARNTATRHTQTYIVAKTNLEKYGESPVCEIRLRGLPVLYGFVGRVRRAFIGHLSGVRILGSIRVGIGRDCGVPLDVMIVIIGAVDSSGMAMDIERVKTTMECFMQGYVQGLEICRETDHWFSILIGICTLKIKS